MSCARGHLAALAVEGVGAENAVTSCDLHVLLYETTEPVSSQGPEAAQERVGLGPAGGEGREQHWPWPLAAPGVPGDPASDGAVTRSS